MADPIRVLIADEMSKKAVEVLTGAGFSVEVKTGMKPEELASVIGEYHGVGIRSASKITAATLANPGKLKIIGRAGVGVDNIDVKAANEKNILVINTPQGNAAAAAELAIGLMFALARKIPQASASMKQGIWEKKKYMGVEIAGKTLGVVGLGNIGRQAAERGVGLKMNVLGYDPFPPKQPPAGVTLASLDDLIAKSDFITLHVPLHAGDEGALRGGDVRQDEEGRLPHQLRPRRGGGRKRRPRGAHFGPTRRSRPRRVREGAAGAVAALRAREPDRHPAPRRVHQRSAGEGGHRAGGSFRRLLEGRNRPQRGQVTVGPARPATSTAPKAKMAEVPILRLPAGMRDYAPDAAAARRRTVEALCAVFERRGFARVITPAFEYEDVLALGLGDAARAATVRFVEPSSGQVVALRPDITPQIARLIATRFRQERGPVRLCYEGTVVRLTRGGRGQRELIQAGVELAGLPGPDGDAEMIGLAVEALAAVGLRAPPSTSVISAWRARC